MIAKHFNIYMMLSDEDREYIKSCARIRNISVTRLMTATVSFAIRDKMLEAILDDDSKPWPSQRYQKGYKDRSQKAEDVNHA